MYWTGSLLIRYWRNWKYNQSQKNNACWEVERGNFRCQKSRLQVEDHLLHLFPYISLSNSLPATSNIKIVDVWLLFSLFFPFFIILINILLYTTRGRNKSPITKTEQMRNALWSVEAFLKSIVRNALPFIYICFLLSPLWLQHYQQKTIKQ